MSNSAGMNECQFRINNAFEKRQEISKKIREKYKDRIPIIIYKDPKANAPTMSKLKFLVPDDFTLGKFIHEMRKHMDGLKPEQAIYIFVNNRLPPVSMHVGEIYNKNKDEDGFLYLSYSGENTFG